MSEQNRYPTNGYKRDFHRLNDLNLSSFWWHGGAEWTSIIKDEIIHDTNESEQSYVNTHKPVMYSVIAIFILLGAAILTRTGEISTTVESAQNHSVQSIIYSQK